MTFWPWPPAPEPSEDRHCEHCGEPVSREDYFNNVRCPECGRPCGEPF